MQKKYLLPPLSTESIITNADCWEEKETPYDFLLKYMQLYYETNVSIFDGGSNAIPHAYEQMLIFHKAFFDTHHPEHRRAVLEWRAILMIMALQKIKNLHLDLVKVDLQEESKNPFIRAAARLCPEDKPIIYNTTWDFLYVLRLKGKSIAIFSPMTLVCPAKQFFKKIKKNINPEWLSLEKINGEEDLIVKTRKNDNLYSNLAEWLEKLQDEVSYCSSTDDDYNSKIDQVKKELDEFISSCKAAGSDGKDSRFYVKDEVYPVMKNSIRKEYSFLNCYCNFMVDDPKFDFLIDRYEEDVFAERLMIVVYDERPGAIENRENIAKLDKLFHHTLEIKGEQIIRVKEYGGQRVAAYALLPFREQLVSELIQNNISPGEFFEEFSVIYNPLKEQMEITLQIKGFPYVYEKAYQKKSWQLVYGKDITETYIWPKGQMDALHWKLYYTYAGSLNSNVQISVPKAEKQVTYCSEKGTKAEKRFQLSRTETFPAYVCFTSQGVNGYLPVKTEHIGQRYVGSVLDVFIDIGHTTTSVIMIKRKIHEGKEITQRIAFAVAPSKQIAGERSENNTAKSNFIGTDANIVGRSYFKNMIHRFDGYESVSVSDSDIGTMGKGQVLYNNRCYGERIKDSVVSFLNFEYIHMQERDRENVHIYIQQILLNIVYQAIKQECSYLKVHFLHSYDSDNDNNLGELYALWGHAIERTKEWTGIYKNYGEVINGLQNYKALTYNTYYLMKNSTKEITGTVQDEHIYIGMDIGWKHTCAIFLASAEEKKQQIKKVSYAQLEYAGRDISLMHDEEAQLRYNFKRYAEMLSILLNGKNDFSEETQINEILSEFEKMYMEDGDNPKNREYYQGIYDVIAMMIEEKNFDVSPDVYNNMAEFRNFIAMMTYNILLIFFEIGILLGRVEGKKEKATIYLSGNGAKFIKWISNEKDYDKIDSNNCKKVWMLELKNSVLDIINAGLKITNKQSSHRNLEIKIVLQENMKEQLLEGYIYKEIPSMFEKDAVIPEFEYEMVGTNLQTAEVEIFENALEEIYHNVFGEIESETNVDLSERSSENGTKKIMDSSVEVAGELSSEDGADAMGENCSESKTGNQSVVDSINILTKERRRVCRKIIERINKM